MIRVTIHFINRGRGREHEAISTNERDGVYFVYTSTATYKYPLVNVLEIIEISQFGETVVS